jgi:RNA polymerase sigma-70 factor (ECF subfamily)
MDDNILPLIKGCLANDSSSWNILLQACTSIALNHHRKHFSSLSPDDTDVIVSNVYTKLFDGGLGKFTGATKYELLGYFKTITQNETFSFLRQHMKRKREVSLDQSLGEDDDQVEFTLQNLLPDNSLRPDIIAQINDLYRKAMGQLSVRDQQILLYKVEGYKDREIAELLGIPANTVASSYSRLKETLQRNLAMAILIILSGRNWPGMTS